MLRLTGARVVTSQEVLDDAAVVIDGGQVSTVERGGKGEDLGGGYLVPGFVDIHCHGAAGADFGTASIEDAQRSVDLHLRHGTTGLLASLVTAAVDDLVTQTDRLATIVHNGPLLGVHLEGPFLSAARCGAQNTDHMIDPTVSDAKSLVASGVVRMMTLAPELPGALDVLPTLLDAGVLAAVGHTDATYEQARAAFDAGATVATHLFNGMRPLHHRDPGPVLAALDAGAACEVINDGHHVHEAVVRLVHGRDPDALVLVTDAISATGAGDGSVELGGQPVDVRDGVARLRSTGDLAGSTLTMDAAFRRAVQIAGLPLAHAVRATSSNPARALGLAGERGDIAPGLRADLVHLDDDLRVRAVMYDGAWIE